MDKVNYGCYKGEERPFLLDDDITVSGVQVVLELLNLLSLALVVAGFLDLCFGRCHFVLSLY